MQAVYRAGVSRSEKQQEQGGELGGGTEGTRWCKPDKKINGLLGLFWQEVRWWDAERHKPRKQQG